jgi:hypothetical protein
MQFKEEINQNATERVAAIEDGVYEAFRSDPALEKVRRILAGIARDRTALVGENRMSEDARAALRLQELAARSELQEIKRTYLERYARERGGSLEPISTLPVKLSIQDQSVADELARGATQGEVFHLRLPSRQAIDALIANKRDDFFAAGIFRNGEYHAGNHDYNLAELLGTIKSVE